ncbi:MAG: hypothetical protein PHX52_02680 [Candidatus Pacebacteria bacterium]|nr:hypothetical protein [Candidatus Paceibacterota bacterium]
MKSVINIKTEKEVKENAQKIAKELGLSLSDVVNASLRNFIKTREVHFYAVPKMTEELECLLTKVEEDIKKNISSGFSSSFEVSKYLDSL